MDIEKRLYEAALEGNVSALKALIQEDPLILDRVSITLFHETPLHIAILRGHLEFVRAVLSHNSQLATELDSLGHTPLHLASAKGHVEIVRELLSASPNACLARSKDGKVPLHLVIMKGGRVEVVKELTRACPESTRLRLDRGETIYHLCVKYNNLEALQVLVEELVGENDTSAWLNAKDDDGNTLFHLAALNRHLEIIKYLVARPDIELNTENNNGLTALDLVENSPRDLKGLEVLNFLIESNAQRASNEHSSFPTKKVSASIITQGYNNVPTRPRSRTKSWKKFFTFSGANQLEELQGELFITSAIIVLITVLPIINIKVNGSGSDLTDEYSITTLSLVPALSIMVLLLGGFPLSNKFCAWLVIQLMYTALGFLGLNYIGEIISNESRYVNVNITFILMCIWFILLIMVSLLNMIRFIVWLVKSIKGFVKRRKLLARRQDVLSNA